MDTLTIIATSVGTLVALFPLAFVAYLNGGGVYHQLRLNATKKKGRFAEGAPAGTCSADADCPPGYSCENGSCVPQGS